ncbi:MAG: hypothetical protein JRG92_05110 [Deltaproteobacteria bacterium]|jgi:hypothetical protein|nr:hypothetical protein [Deltaproteobacteria bacterium]
MNRVLIALCLAALVAGCATSSEEEPPAEPTPVVQPAPPAAPAPVAEPEPTPVAEPVLPETAGTLPLVGMAGAGALALAGALRALRRFLA